jgi:hypothetical protein
VAEFLAESRAYTERVDEALAAELAAGPRTLAELTVSLGPSLGDWPAEAHAFLSYPFLGHLERMIEFGRVSVRRRGALAEYVIAGEGSA